MNMKKCIFLFLFYWVVGVLAADPVFAIPINLFNDDFNDNSIDSSKWTQDITGDGSVQEQNQCLMFTIYRHHVYLQSAPFSVPNWANIDFSGSWAIPSHITPEFDLFVYDADNPSHYFRVNYQSWGGPNLRFMDSGPIMQTSKRTPPKSMTDFFLHFTDSGWEYGEGGSLVGKFSSTTMEGAERFYIKIGGWDCSHVYNQNVYYDNISVSADVTPVPEPATFLLLGPSLLALAGLRKKHKKTGKG